MTLPNGNEDITLRRFGDTWVYNSGVEVSEITDGGLLGVNEILDDISPGSDDGMVGIGSMEEGRDAVSGVALLRRSR